MTQIDWRRAYLSDVLAEFNHQRGLAERALAQLQDADLFRAAGPDDNSIAVLLKHVGGNLRSRWTEPFETDGEKPDRNRPGEFEAQTDSAAAVRAVWEQGWSVLESTLAGFQAADIERTLVIRGERHTLFRALHRSLAHTSQHVGQIILLAKQWKGTAWQTLSIPRTR